MALFRGEGITQEFINGIPIPISSGNGVTEIVAGSNITISPTPGTGKVTVSASSGGSGNISGTLTAGKYPVASDTHTLVDGTIDFGVTTSDTLTITNAGTGSAGGLTLSNSQGTVGGTNILDIGPGGIFINSTDTTGDGNGITISSNSFLDITNVGTIGTTLQDSGGGGLTLNAYGGGTLTLEATGTSASIAMNNTGEDGTLIQDGGGGGLELNETGSGGILIQSTSGTKGIHLSSTSGNINITGLLVPTLIYSASGTPLPSAVTGLEGARAFVSDALASTYGATYTSGNSTKAPVWCDGTTWYMG